MVLIQGIVACPLCESAEVSRTGHELSWAGDEGMYYCQECDHYFSLKKAVILSIPPGGPVPFDQIVNSIRQAEEEVIDQSIIRAEIERDHSIIRHCHECTYCYTRRGWLVHRCGGSRPPHRTIDPDDRACEEFLDIMEVA